VVSLSNERETGSMMHRLIFPVDGAVVAQLK
jgi:hypothetical protein